MRRGTAPTGTPRDLLGRPLHDLRISVTDRCNFRCTYCMPKEIFGRDYAFLPKDQVLSFEEIDRVSPLGGPTNLGVCCGRIGEADVVSDGALKQTRALRDEGQHAPKLRFLNLLLWEITQMDRPA